MLILSKWCRILNICSPESLTEHFKKKEKKNWLPGRWFGRERYPKIQQFYSHCVATRARLKKISLKALYKYHREKNGNSEGGFRFGTWKYLWHWQSSSWWGERQITGSLGHWISSSIDHQRAKGKGQRLFSKKEFG